MAAPRPPSRSKDRKTSDAEPLSPRFRLMRLLFLCALLGATAVLATAPLCRWQANSSLNQREYETAAQWIENSEWWGESSESLLLRSRLQRKLLDVDESRRLLDRAVKRGLSTRRAEHELWLILAQAGQIQGIEPQLNKWLLESDRDVIELCEAYANGLLMNARPDDALALLQTWRQMEPTDPQPWLIEGRWQESQKQMTQAKECYGKALKYKPDYPPALYATARLQEFENHPEEVLRQLDQLAKQIRANAAPRIAQARLLQQAGQSKAALALLMPLTERPPAEVVRSYALVQDPDPGRPLDRTLGEVLSNLSEFEQALPHLDRVLQIEPRSPTIRYLKAQALQGLGQGEAARQLFAEVAADRTAITEADRLIDEITKIPTDPQIQKRLKVGELFWKHDSARQAEFWMKSVLTYDPTNVTAHQVLADYYRLRQQDDEAFAAAADHHRQLARKYQGRVSQPATSVE